MTALEVFLYATITALATGLGALPFLFVRRMSRRWLGISNGLAAGLMTGASVGLLLEGAAFGAVRVVVGVALGLATADGVPFDRVSAGIAALLRARHQLAPGEEDDFSVRSLEEIASVLTSTTTTMTWLLAAVAAVSLLVGGIGIMNIMLVSVTERTREIGLRLSVGARDVDVLLQFLVEAVVLSLAGGAIGIAAGFGASLAVGRLMNWPVLVTPDAVLMSFGFAAAVGVFFGFYPARKAAALDPIAALRYE